MTSDWQLEDARRIRSVISLTNSIENTMKHLISAYLGIPEERKEFFHSYAANSAIMPFGSKTKLIFAVASQLGVKLDRESFHTLLSRRNAFAHQDPATSIRIAYDENGQAVGSFVIESVKSNGELEAINQHLAYQQFIEAVHRAQESLGLLKDAITQGGTNA